MPPMNPGTVTEASFSPEVAAVLLELPMWAPNLVVTPSSPESPTSEAPPLILRVTAPPPTPRQGRPPPCRPRLRGLSPVVRPWRRARGEERPPVRAWSVAFSSVIFARIRSTST